MILLRDETQMFAREMEKQLLANDHKGGWHRECDEFLFSELQNKVEQLKRLVYASPDVKVEVEDIMDCAADIGNFAMMIADNNDALSPDNP